MTAQTIPEKTAVERPPAATVGPIAWIRGNLFNTWYNALITVAIAWALISWLPGLINWAFIDAVWGRAAPEACKAAEGACWAFIREKYRLILFGTYPYEEQWRPLASILIFVTLVAASGYRKFWSRKLVYVWVAAITLICLLMWGGVFGLPLVETRLWGGLMITLVLSVFGCGKVLIGDFNAQIGRSSPATGTPPLIRTGHIQRWLPLRNPFFNERTLRFSSL